MIKSNMSNTYEKNLIDSLHQSCASGDIEKLQQFVIHGSRLLEATSESGWTALMFAARNGHSNVVEWLLANGCNQSSINASGQCALDIALFWNHPSVVRLLRQAASEDAISADHYLGQGMRHFFTNSVLDRAAELRKNSAWQEASLKKDSSCYILLHDLHPFVSTVPNNTAKFCLTIFGYSDVQSLLANCPVVLFLGREQHGPGEPRAWYALDVTPIDKIAIQNLKENNILLQDPIMALQLEVKDSGILSVAKSMLSWHARYKFCATCGGRTKVEDSGFKRTCLNADCASNKGIHNTCYPRIDPTVIMAVISQDQHILLARGKNHPQGMYSCLAGFMEPGESIEDTCRRETFEESGILVGRVDYHSCQFWPMPCSLMIGCMAYATSTEIKIDPEEICDAKWFNRTQVVQLLHRNHPDGLFCPPEQAIAHHLIKTWVQMTSNL